MTRGFDNLSCFNCNEEGDIHVCLADGSIFCNSCETTFRLEEITSIIDAWTKAIAWINTMPERTK